MALKVLELFAGIGACSKALTNLGIDYEIVDAVEIDKYAVKSFNAIHGTNFEPQDITTWDKDIDCDLIMHGSPCQDFSVAGKQAGGDEGSGTRSSLLYETLRIVEKLKPKYVIWENVKNVISEKHKHNFDDYLSRMSELGYTNYYQVLNAKDYGIPQNRERVFTISILKEISVDNSVKPSVAKNFEREKYEILNSDKEIYQCQCDSGWKDNKVGIKVSPTIRANNNNTFILDTSEFAFPPKQELELRLKDMLEDNVDEKYYLKQELLEKIILKDDKNEVKRIGGIFDNDKHHQAGSIYNPNGLSPTLDTMKGGWRQPSIITKAYLPEQERPKGNYLPRERVIKNYRIRKLTPLECWRLMGFDDEDFYKAEKVNSNTQLYKQAGNSIVVNVLVAIFKELFKEGDK